MCPSRLPPNDDITEGRSTARHALVFAELLDQAAALFDEKGYSTTSLHDIAAAVGISRPAIYHYFSSKDDLLNALVHQASEAIDKAIASTADRADLSATERLREMTKQLVRQRATSPGLFRILDRADAVRPAEIRGENLDARRHTLEQLTALIEEGIAAGEFKPFDPGLAALAILGMCNWVAWWFGRERGYDVETVVAHLSQSAVDTVIKRASRRARRPDSLPEALERVRESLDAAEALLPGRSTTE